MRSSAPRSWWPLRGLSLALALAGVGCSGDDVQYGPEICDNQIDDDGDGALDCDDRDCVAECSEVCDNQTDDDGDGLVDCADDDCFSTACTEVCGDGEDNDLDGYLDCADIDCIGSCPEVCDDAIDNDGDGLADCADPDCHSTCDADDDGYFAAWLGYDDCDDTNPEINPAANEVCDKVDNDCDNLIDDEDSDVRGAIFYRDEDGDGYGTGSQTVLTCSGQPPGSADNNLDCDDQDADIHPLADEVCNGIDDDCNTLVDEADPNLVALNTWYVDADRDGYGDPTQLVAEACRPPGPSGYARNGDDCDDRSQAVHPGRAELVCDGLDNDCDPATLDDPADADGDGFTVCDGDCDDLEPAAHPGGIEVLCTGIDEDCDPLTRDDADEDQDGYRVCGGDCDDTDARVNPGRPERTCDGLDNDCDPVGTPDDPNVDADMDGYTECMGDCDDLDPTAHPYAVEVLCTGIDEDCDPLTRDDADEDQDGYRVCGGDCDDLQPDVHPGAMEVCEDGIDQDCSGSDYAPCDTEAEGLWLDEGVVDLAAGTFTGTRTYRYTGALSGHVFCEWVWDTTDWDHDPEVSGPAPVDTALCMDADGNPCDFAFAINARDSRQTRGDCASFGLITPGGDDIEGTGIGYLSDYRSGGIGVGPVVMYPYGSSWYIQTSSVYYTSPDFNATTSLGTVPAPY